MLYLYFVILNIYIVEVVIFIIVIVLLKIYIFSSFCKIENFNNIFLFYNSKYDFLNFNFC